MKISIQAEGHNINLRLPTRMIFSKTVARIVNFSGRKYAGEGMDSITPEQMDALFAEFRRIKKMHGSWELVDVESADGEKVNITL